MLDFDHPDIAGLIATMNWARMPPDRCAQAIYDFVRNNIALGFNAADELPASAVLADGMGQCNTKATLLMALLRGSGLACRLRGFMVDKRLQKGLFTGIAYRLAPAAIVHTWAEVRLDGRWIALEGCIVDTPYLRGLQRRFASDGPSLCGYAVATPDLQHAPVNWTGNDTFIQREAITADLGYFDSPDDFFRVHRQAVGPVRRWLYTHGFRHLVNRRVARIRAAGL